MKCTAEDLLHLMSYVLDTLNPADRTYLINAMRHVGPIQRWGMYAAGPAQQPGVKNGWSIEPDGGSKHWVTNTVGFAGPDERYVVAVMYQLPPGLTINTGVHTVSDLVATLFGRHSGAGDRPRPEHRSVTANAVTGRQVATTEATDDYRSRSTGRASMLPLPLSSVGVRAALMASQRW